jgi:AraC family transcriptional regulator of adaptative response/methylated-DNA-[protein]-cysteine methyltransferase
MEAVTPGEFAQKGRGLNLYYGVHPTAFGFVFVAQTERGVCQITFLEDEHDPQGLNQLTRQWPNANLVQDEQQTRCIAEALFHQLPASVDDQSTMTKTKPVTSIRLLAKGTNFQVQVWKALLNLPYGSVTSYQRIAEAIGKPKAVRAVASAIGANPLAYLIPCHRVLRGTGELGGYRWGLARKSALLAWEAES